MIDSMQPLVQKDEYTEEVNNLINDGQALLAAKRSELATRALTTPQQTDQTGKQKKNSGTNGVHQAEGTAKKTAPPKTKKDNGHKT